MEIHGADGYVHHRGDIFHGHLLPHERRHPHLFRGKPGMRMEEIPDERLDDQIQIGIDDGKDGALIPAERCGMELLQIRLDEMPDVGEEVIPDLVELPLPLLKENLDGRIRLLQMYRFEQELLFDSLSFRHVDNRSRQHVSLQRNRCQKRYRAAGFGHILFFEAV